MKRILIADDDAATRRLLVAAIKQAEMSSEEAATGNEAVTKLQYNHFDAVIVDLELGDMSGFVLLKRIREISKNRDIIAVMYSGTHDLEVAMRARRAGAHAYLGKPYGLRTIATTILKLINAPTPSFWPDEAPTPALTTLTEWKT